MKQFRLLLLLALLLTAATGAWAQESATTYSVKMKSGTVDAANWSIASGEKSAKGDAADGLTGLSEKDPVTLTYTGRLKVKGVTATWTAAAPAAAEGHALSASAVGEIVGTDGLAYAVADKDNLPEGVTAAGLVAYKNGNNGLAIALTDEPSTMSWDNAMGESGAKAHTPAVTGQTWKLPSSDDIKNMLSSYDSYWPDLNGAIVNVGGTGLLDGSENSYWLSDEEEDEARYMRDLSDEPKTTTKGETYRVRSVIAF